MAQPTIMIHDLDPHRVGEAAKLALNTFDNRLLREQWPDDPPHTVDDTIAQWRCVPRYSDLHQWTAWNEADHQVVARGAVTIGRYAENRHLADFDIVVVPEMRRQGLATRLLSRIAAVARQEDRQLLLASTDAAIPAGGAFMRRLGARMGVASHTYQLAMAGLNQSLVDQWCQRGRQRRRAFALDSWEGPHPSAEAAAMARMKEVMNTTPTDDLDFEPFRWTVEDVRQEERELANRGLRRWTMVLRHLEAGEIAAYTEALWQVNHPETLTQGNTAVVPSYRNRGLAQWLKGEMLRRLIDTRPEVQRIRTDVADSNAAMRRINRQLGFQPYKAWTTWQVDLDQVAAYLREAGTHGS